MVIVLLQNKLKIVECKSIEYTDGLFFNITEQRYIKEKPRICGFTIGENKKIVLGKYNTAKRAKEIFKDIMKYIEKRKKQELRCLYENAEQWEHMYGNMMDIDCSIYKMPKE